MTTPMHPESPSREATACTGGAESGAPAIDGIDTLFGAIYPEILSLARRRLARERSPVSTLTLAHELYLDLSARPQARFGTREQFLAYAGRVMRSLLVDLARKRMALKRSADVLPLTIGIEAPDPDGTPEQLVALDEAMTRLGQVDARLLRIAEMSIIMGMSVRDMAAALRVSEPTIKRDWRRAKAYLQEELGAAS